ncbi:MAG: Crp/Fnr family transcriptional regulator [Gammaproteobacteria bacterium]|nr:Crp/Fnr family transcriptional regulator [Gammaproteobacteria bacterium]
MNTGNLSAAQATLGDNLATDIGFDVAHAENVYQGIPLFSSLTESDLATVSRHAVTKTFSKNTIIINEGDTTDSLYVILCGRVKAFLSDEQGREVILDIEGPGDYFGEIALLDEPPRSASVMTLESSRFSIILKNGFKRCLANNPDIAIALIKALTHRIRMLTDNVKGLALRDVYGRVAKTLSNLAKREESGKQVIAEKLTQQELASMVGASREMVSRILKDLITGGYIKIEDKRITIERRLPAGW